MRFLSTFCGLLLLGNLLVLLWPSSDSRATHAYVERSEVNPHFIRLNKEIEQKHHAKKTLEESQDPVALSSDDFQGCYRLGPFMHRENFELAQAVLYNANVEYQKSMRKSQQSTVFRVFLGPYSSQAEAVDARDELRRKNILDHFIRKQKDLSYVLSLGIYTTAETANAALAQLSGIVEGVLMKQEDLLLPDSYWLILPMEGEVKTRQQLSRMDWGEPSAKFGKYACATA